MGKLKWQEELYFSDFALAHAKVLSSKTLPFLAKGFCLAKKLCLSGHKSIEM